MLAKQEDSGSIPVVSKLFAILGYKLGKKKLRACRSKIVCYQPTKDKIKVIVAGLPRQKQALITTVWEKNRRAPSVSGLSGLGGPN